MASSGLIKQSRYSGSLRSRSIRLSEAFFSRSTTMLARTPHFLARQHTPTAAPMQSRSAKRWPITSTREESRTSSARVVATTRLFTFVRFSTSEPRPP